MVCAAVHGGGARGTLAALAYNLVVVWNGKRRRCFRQMIGALRDTVCPEPIVHDHNRLKTTR
jgi:hypothetical protein